MKRSQVAYAAALTLGLTVAATNASAQTPTSPPPTSTPPTGTPTSPPPATPATPAGAPAAGNAVRLHVTSDKNKKPARLYIHRNDGQYVLVCSSPCTTDVPVGSDLRITLDDNEDEPHSFKAPGDLGPEVDVQVKPASVGPLVGGIVAMGGGGVFVLTGLLFVALADVSDSANKSSSSITKSVSDTYKVTGYVCIGLGAAAAIVGLIVLTTRSREPRISGGPHQAAAPQAPQAYGRTDTLLGDLAALRPRDPMTTSVAPAFTPLTYGFAF